MSARCPNHPHVTLRCPACVGQEGGRARTVRKKLTARHNGRKGGRPPQKTMGESACGGREGSAPGQRAAAITAGPSPGRGRRRGGPGW
jgi:hypothetical protein